MANRSKLWLDSNSLVLASRSSARISMLMRAKIPIEIVPADIDERAIEVGKCGELHPAETAQFLSEVKALSVSTSMPDRLVLGSDQTLELEGQVYSKITRVIESKARLQILSGRVHKLHSGFCFARDGKILHSGVESAELTMRRLTDHFIDAYLETSGLMAVGSIGVYEVEGAGVHLFEKIEGDWFTILGLPLRDVISFLRADGRLLA